MAYKEVTWGINRATLTAEMITVGETVFVIVPSDPASFF
jgi:hypothetical protein